MDFSDDIEGCLAVLKKGGLILYPTDTIWGIGCNATNVVAVSRIYALKKREESKSMIIMVADEWEVMQHAANVYPEIFNYLDQAARPTTVIYDGAIDIAENLENDEGTVAIRIVKDDFCKHLIRRLGKPIVSTSANISGQPPPDIFNNITEEIKNGVDYVVKYRQDDFSPKEPSTIIKLNRDGSISVLR